MKDLRDVTFCVIDIETTGLSSEHDKICEIAFVVTTMKEVIYTAETLVNPGIPIPALASAVHHIVDDDVIDAPMKMPYGIKLPKRDCYVAHNAGFDSSFLPELSKARWLCTMRLAKRVRPEMEAFTNQYLRYALGVKVDFPGQALPHRALPDALVTAALLRHFLSNLPEEAPTTVSAFLDWCNQPLLLKKCNFGNKHRGKLWSEVPLDYLAWMDRTCTDLDADTRHTVSYHLASSQNGKC